MSLAKEREKRSNAGSRMAKLLDAEDEDEFYKTTYGGFEEEAEDVDYASEKSLSDYVDSDFSIDENDEVKSDMEEDEPKRKKRVVTKAYKEPGVKKTQPTKDDKPKPKKAKVKSQDRSTVQIYHSGIDRKSLRRSTANQTNEVQLREAERQARSQMMKEIAARKNVSEVRRLTQQELLEEAKLTEEINLRSLESYQRMELEKRKARVQKQAYKGPIIRYHSVTMPLIEELPVEAEINVDEETNENGMDGEPQVRKPHLKSTDKCSRTFITFTDETVFKGFFPQKKARVPIKQYCPVTRLPAKYFDPITQTPYANMQAFKIIREAYNQQLEEKESKRSRKSQQNEQISAKT